MRNEFVQDICAFLAPRLRADEQEVARLIEVPPDEKMGDYALPCFSLAPKLRKAPAAIAEELAAAFVPTAAVLSARPHR